MRKKAMKLFHKGYSAETISYHLQINLKTVQIWIFEETGSITVAFECEK